MKISSLKIDNLGAYLTTGGGVAAAQLISFASIPFIARLSGPEIFGQYSYYFSLITVLCVFCSFKLELSFFTLNDKDIQILESFFFKHILLCGGLIASAFTAIYYSGDLADILLFLSFFFSFFAICGFEFRIQKNIKLGEFMWNAKGRVCRAALFPLFYGFFYFIDFTTFHSIIIAFACANLTADIVFLNNKKAEHSTLPFIASIRHLWPKVKRTVLYLTPAHFLNRYTSGAIILIAGFYDESYAAEIALYAIAVKFLVAPANIVISATSDVIKREVLVNPKAALKNFKKISLFTVSIGAVVSGVVYFLGAPIAALVLGESWIGVADYAVALLPYFLVILIFSPITHTYVILKRQDIDFYWQVFNAIAISCAVLVAINSGFLMAVKMYSVTAAAMMLVSFLICYKLISEHEVVQC
ncbi:lipopolysaccharide biosynthesis protein [Motilimonas pumila]|uniref:Lipopolysaccharide biosynthesis protein n=1 Tax=Motilimonas pumila TaxID=2303987 RepID=A0A418YKY0_9GAMM|nr:hypothetical protein [Motilimonas pumila]RJG51636.1 hypothetical protein D1Z90_02600 [Motilimonas pumila]